MGSLYVTKTFCIRLPLVLVTLALWNMVLSSPSISAQIEGYFETDSDNFLFSMTDNARTFAITGRKGWLRGRRLTDSICWGRIALRRSLRSTFLKKFCIWSVKTCSIPYTSHISAILRSSSPSDNWSWRSVDLRIIFSRYIHSRRPSMLRGDTTPSISSSVASPSAPSMKQSWNIFAK